MSIVAAEKILKIHSPLGQKSTKSTFPKTKRVLLALLIKIAFIIEPNKEGMYDAYLVVDAEALSQILSGRSNT